MLAIQLDPSELVVANGTPHAGYYFVVAILPSKNPGNVIKLGPSHDHSNTRLAPGHSRLQFFLSLAAADSNRPGAFPALLPPAFLDDKTWNADYDQLRKTSPSSLIDFDNSVLDISVFEWLTATMPREVVRGSIPEMDGMVKRGMENMHLINENPINLPTSLLSSRRIGHVRLILLDLLNAWLSNKQCVWVMEVNDRNAPHGQVVHRGTLHVSAQQSHLGDHSDQSSYLRFKAIAARGGNPLERYELAANTCNSLKDEYSRAYLAPFPPFEAPFQLVNSNGFRGPKPHSYAAYLDGQSVQVSGQLIPEKNDMNNIHMPTAKIDGLDAHVPVHHLFKMVPSAADQGAWDEAFYVSCYELACACFNTSPHAVQSSIHDWLDRKHEEGAPVSLAMLANWRVVGSLLSSLIGAAVTYRSDVTLAGNDRIDRNDHVVLPTEDIARDLATCTCGSADCEDCAFAIHYFYTGILQGSTKLTSPSRWRERDSLWKEVYTHTKFGTSMMGSWSHPGLDAIQRLLSYYCVANILGTVTAAFPGEKHAPSTQVRDLDEAEQMYRASNQRGVAGTDAILVRELDRYNFTSAANLNGLSDAHRWAVAIPLKHTLRMVLNSAEAENRHGTKRHPEDESALRQLSEFHSRMPYVPLPSLTLEGTTCMDPYAVVGASHWLSKNSQEREALRNQEALARRMSVDYRQNIMSKWYEYDVRQLDGGNYRHLPGNLPTRQGSQFYNRALQFDAWIIARLTGSDSLSTFACTHGPEDNTWGIPIDYLLRYGVQDRDTQVPENLGLMPVQHYVPIELRREYDQASRELTRLLLPCSLSFLPPVASQSMIQRPSDQRPGEKPPGLETFAWSIYYISNSLGTNKQTLEAYRKAVNPHSHAEYSFELNLFPMGHRMTGWACRDLVPEKM